MNDPTHIPDETAPAAASAAADGAPVAPKRRRTRAAASPQASAAEAASPATPALEADVAEPPAPKRRTRKAAAPVVEVDVAQVVPVAAVASVAESNVADAAVVVHVPEAKAAVQPAEAVSDPVAAPGDVAGAAPDGSAEPGDDDRGPRGDRKRRRRGPRGDRESGAEGGPPLAGPRPDGEPDRLHAEARGQMPAPPVADVAERFEAVISGQFDQETEAVAGAAEGDAAQTNEALVDASAPDERDPAQAVDGGVADAAGESTDPAKRVLRPEPEAPKLHKVLAASGIGSRRDMEALIEEGQVTVNGEVAHQGMRITWGDQIKVAGRPVKVRIAPSPARVLAYHKPVGEVVTHHDPEGRPTVFKRLPRLPQGKWLSVGRLDLNTEGLLLFTNSGELANQLMHPRFGVEREYAVRVLGELTPAQRQQLLDGVEVEGQKAAFQAIEDGGGSEGANHWWRVVITEGRNREVRKLFDTVGLTVSRLIRIRYGTVVLPRGLKRGVFVELGDNDVRLIRRLAGGDARRPGPGSQAGGVLQGQGAGQGPSPGQGGFNNNPKGGKPQKQRGRNGPGPGQQQSGFAGGPGGGQGGPQQPQRGPKPNGPQNGPRGPRGSNTSNYGNGPGPNAAGPEPYDEHREADDPPFIPNPLEQTFDRRFATGSKRIVAGFGRPGDDSRSGGPGAPRKKGEPREPDPMQTSVGYIGADAYFTKPGGGGNFNNKRGRKR